MLTAVVAFAQVERADAAWGWSDGGFAQSTVTNCVSLGVLFPAPIQEAGVSTYVGYLTDVNTAQPYPGQVYYVHTVVYGVGNPCFGSHALPEFSLPANTSLAISPQNPVYCIGLQSTAQGGNFNDAAECPQSLPPGISGGTYRIPSPDAANVHSWPVPQGKGWEFQIPVVSSAPVNSGTLQGYTKIIDGNSNPVLTPSKSVFVFARTPEVGFDHYTVSATANFDVNQILTTTVIAPYGVGGTAYYDVFQSNGTFISTDSPGVNIPAGTTDYQGITENWLGLTGVTVTAGTTHYFKVRYVTTGGTYTTPMYSMTAQPASGGSTATSHVTTTTVYAGGNAPTGTGAPSVTAPPATDPPVPPTSPTTPGSGTTPGGGTTPGSTPEFVALVPGRILETRTDAGSSTVDGQGFGHGIVAANDTIELQVGGRAGVPADAGAAALNVTVTGAQGTGYATVYPCGATRPTTSNLNFVAGQTIPNAVIAKLGTGGRVCIFTNAGTHLLADVNGFFPVGSSYAPIVPARILETRTDPGSSTIDGQGLGQGVVTGGTEVALQVAGRAGVPSNAGAAVLNVTVTGALGNGYVTVYPCGATRPTTSNLNFVVGQTIPNAVITKIGDGGKVCLFANVGTHLLADIDGYFPAGSSYAPIVPGRILDTRNDPSSSTVDGAFLGHGILVAGDEIQLPVAARAGVPNGATAAVLNVTVTEATGNGYVTVYPCGATRPTTSNLNFVVGQTIPNAVIAKIGIGGKVCIFANVGTHLIADVNGYFPG